MKIRLVLGAAVAMLVTGGLVSTASASDQASGVDTHKLCIEFPSSPTAGSAPGYCVWWNGVQ